MKALATSSIKIFFVLISIFVASVSTSLPIGNFIFWIGIDILFLVAIFILKPAYGKDGFVLLSLFLIWVFISFFRGVIVADNYWEWKFLILYTLTMLAPSIAYLATNVQFVQRVLGYWYKYGLWLIFLLIPFVVKNDFYGTYLAPIMLLLLLYSGLPTQWKIITLFFTIMVFLAGFDSRSNFLRFLVAFSLGFMYYLPFLKKILLLKVLHSLLLVLPVLLLLLGLTGIFNIFKIGQYTSGDYSYKGFSAGKKESLTVDTRTFIYVETIESALKHNYVFQGRTPAKGYDSPWFGSFAKYQLGTGKMVRFASEVSMANIFTWYGLVGVIMYSIIFIVGSSLALYRSNNYFMKVIGVFVAFRWAFGYVEEFNSIDIQMVLLWTLVGMCYSSGFRGMTNNDFRAFTRKMLPKIRF